MFVNVCGLGEFSGLLMIDTPQDVDQQAITGLLSISGVKHYFTIPGGVRIECDKEADIEEVTAKSLRVIVESLGENIGDLCVIVRDISVRETDKLALETSIWLHANSTPTPEPFPMERIIKRGKAPAYYRA